MFAQLYSSTDWGMHVQWLCHRLSAIDGRLRVPKPHEVLDVGQALSSQSATATGVLVGASRQQMQWIHRLMGLLGLRSTRWWRAPNGKVLPMVGLHPQQGLCLVTADKSDLSSWVLETPVGPLNWSECDTHWVFCSAALGWREQLDLGGLGLVKRVLMRHRGPFLGLLLLTLGVNATIAFTALSLSTHHSHLMTGLDFHALFLLALGGFVSLGLTGFLEVWRESISTKVAEDMDADLAHETFARLLKVQAEPLEPQSESFTTQLQLFESVRAFTHTAVTLVVLDVPIALLFGYLIHATVAPVLSLAVAAYVAIKLLQGLLLFWRARAFQAADQWAHQDPVSLMMKTIECAQTVKSLDLRSRYQQRWSVATREQLKQNRGMQHLTEAALNDKPGFGQVGFIVWLLISAYLIEQGLAYSLGAWVGATMLLPRVIHPVSSLPTLCVQWLQAKLALRSIDGIFRLQLDPSEQTHALKPEVHKGQIMLQEVSFVHPNHMNDLRIGHWLIKPGERVGVVGDLGGGKSTLMKLLAGLYKPARGHVWLDQADVQEVPRDLLSLKVAYLPQNVQIFSGTLRDNLLAGLSGVSDSQLLQVCQRVGLMAFVNAHAQGLGMPLHEGPHGLSGGQRQLIGLARLLLRDPLIWLLDDPLANLDESLQHRVLNILSEVLEPHQTLVVVGHQPTLLALVNRLTVLRAGRMVMDGPRDRVLAQWRSRSVLQAA